MKRRIGLILSAVGLAGCVGAGNVPQVSYQLHEMGGRVRLDPAPGPGYDMTVHVKNIWDLGNFDLDDERSRHDFALGFVKQFCPNGRVVSDHSAIVNTVNTQYTKRPDRTHAIRIKC